MPPAQRAAIVVGSGLAGLSAASELIAANIPVHVLERSAKPGGNSIKASSGINGAPTRFQSVIDASFLDDTLKSAGAGTLADGQGELRRRLISTLTRRSADAVYWLADEKGVDLTRVAQLGGHSRARTHRGAGQTPPGAAIISTLLKSLTSSSLFRLDTECLVTRVLRSSEEVHGVEYTRAGETEAVYGPVVFASGGFAGDAEGMLAQYRPDLRGLPSTNEPKEGSQKYLTEVGAQLVDMDQVQVHPTGFVDPKNPFQPVKFLAAEALRGEGGLMLLNGKRFVNEMETRQHVTDAIMRTSLVDISPRQWNIEIVLDEGSYAAASSHVDFYVWKGLMRKTTVAELGPPALSAIQQYADAAAGETADLFGRNAFGHWALRKVMPVSVLYAGRVTPVVHFTMGGVIINEQSEVLDAGGEPIRGLWAAGEISGGIHGENRLGGSSLLECVVFGRIAGGEAAAFCNRKVAEKDS